jgi:nickel transport protein
MNRMFLFTVFAWVMAMPFNAFGHGTDYRLIRKEAVVAAEFFYSDKTPMRYAEILVIKKKKEKVEYQNGRTDKNGRFAFLAETPGEWQMKVNDGMGHAVHATVTVNPVNSESKNTGEISANRRSAVSKKKDPLFGEATMCVRLVFGLSILLNLFLGVYVWKRKP